jgi:hypothetical protein
MSDRDSTSVSEQQRFPIGRFQRREAYTPDERASHIDRLATQPSRLAVSLRGLTARDLTAPYRPGGWTVQQLVHHIADSHLNAYIRIKLGLTEDEPTIKPYDQDAWVALADRRVSPHVSLALLGATHERLVAVLRGMREEDFSRSIIHPENGRMSLDQVVAMYAWHGDHHLAHLDAFRKESGRRETRTT